MEVSRQTIVSRGLRLRCPNCGEPTLFKRAAMRINERCTRCGLGLNRGEGFFLGPMVINYAIVVFVFAAPCILLWALGMLPLLIAGGLALAGCVVLPIVFYRISWSLWLMLYFCLLPDRLPANGGSADGDATE